MTTQNRNMIRTANSLLQTSRHANVAMPACSWHYHRRRQRRQCTHHPSAVRTQARNVHRKVSNVLGPTRQLRQYQPPARHHICRSPFLYRAPSRVLVPVTVGVNDHALARKAESGVSVALAQTSRSTSGRCQDIATSNECSKSLSRIACGKSWRPKRERTGPRCLCQNICRHQ